LLGVISSRPPASIASTRPRGPARGSSARRADAGAFDSMAARHSAPRAPRPRPAERTNRTRAAHRPTCRMAISGFASAAGGRLWRSRKMPGAPRRARVCSWLHALNRRSVASCPIRRCSA